MNLPENAERGWGDRRRSPARVWDGEPRSWHERTWRFLRPVDRRTIFVAEVFSLDEDGLDDLALLRARGWCVRLVGGGHQHTSSLAILLVKANGGSTNGTGEAHRRSAGCVATQLEGNMS